MDSEHELVNSPDVDNLSNVDIFEQMDTEIAESESVNSRLLQQIFDKKASNIKKNQTCEEWAVNSSQIEFRNNEELQNEQNKVILQLQSQTTQLLHHSENETQWRLTVNMEKQKIKKNMSTLKNYFETLKTSIERCVNSKNKLEKTYQQGLNNIQETINENNMKIKLGNQTNLKLRKKVKIHNEKFELLKKEYIIYQKNREEEIHILKNNESKLVEINKELEEKKENLLEDINEVLQEKRQLFEEFTNCKENYEKLVLDYNSELESIKKILSETERVQAEDKETIKNLTKELEDYKASLEDQSNFTNEILLKTDKFETTILNLEKENENLKNIVNNYKTELEVTKHTMQHDLTIAQNSCVEFEDSINMLREDFNHLKQENETAKDMIMTLTKNMEQKQENENKLEENLLTLKNNLQELQKEKEIYVQQILELKEEVEKKDETYKELEDKYTKNTTNLQDRYDNIFIEKQNLIEENKQLIDQYENLKIENKHMINEIKEEAGKKIKEIVEHNETYKNEYEKIRQNEKTKLTREITKLTETVKTMELQMSELKASKQFLENELNQKIRETVQLAEEKEKLTSKHYDNNQAVYNYHSDENPPKVLDENIRIEKPKTTKGKFMNKVRDPLPWNDSWSDSSIETEYVSTAWKAKLPLSSQRLFPNKRKYLSTPVNDEKKKTSDDIFESLRSSTSSFQQPENKMKKPRSNRKI